MAKYDWWNQCIAIDSFYRFDPSSTELLPFQFSAFTLQNAMPSLDSKKRTYEMYHTIQPQSKLTFIIERTARLLIVLVLHIKQITFMFLGSPFLRGLEYVPVLY